ECTLPMRSTRCGISTPLSRFSRRTVGSCCRCWLVVQRMLSWTTFMIFDGLLVLTS
ncbi:hypothetical protein Pmar_PMAR000003, partial [Perkinsus marinus ATCC 50983]